jgi:proline iminopeptidase
MLHRILLNFLIAAALTAIITVETRAATNLTEREGFVQVPGGPVWYRVFGSGSKTPLLVVHGGPGASSCAYEPFATLLSKDRPVIVYDQLGSGRSGRPMDRALWTVDRSVRELSAVRKALGLTTVHLLGHSWGGALVTAYIIGTKPSGIKSLVLAGPLLSTKMWIDDANILRQQLPQNVQEALQRNEQAGTTQSEEYQKATEVFYDQFLYHRQPPIKKPDGCAEAPFNEEIYELMWGPTEFNATGTLLNFDVTPHLSELKIPVAFFVGRFDEARLETIKQYQAMIPGSTIKVFEKSGHMAPLEESTAYAAALGAFLRQADQKAGR